MQLLVAPVFINALHSVDPTLVGKVVPCSEPIITSSALSISSFSLIVFVIEFSGEDEIVFCFSASH